MIAYCKCCKKHYDTEECPDNHDPECGVCYECISSGKNLEADENEELDGESIALIQWGDPSGEYPDNEKVRLLLEPTLDNGDSINQILRTPRMAALKIDSPIAQDLLRTLNQFFADHTKLLVVYFACHGNDTGFAYNKEGQSTIPYAEFYKALSESMSLNNFVHLIFGTCEMMSSTPPIESLLPRPVNAVSGFSGCPAAADVAGLVASVIIEDVALLDKCSAARRAICGIGVPDEKVAVVINVWKEIRETHKKDPSQEVSGTGGVAVVQAIRDSFGGNWDRKIIPLTPVIRCHHGFRGMDVHSQARQGTHGDSDHVRRDERGGSE